MVLQYGVANIVNAALNLLQVWIKLWVILKILFKDEEEEVREAAARFASGLPRVDSKVLETAEHLLHLSLSPQTSSWAELSQQRATESLVLWALHHLQQVVGNIYEGQDGLEKVQVHRIGIGSGPGMNENESELISKLSA